MKVFLIKTIIRSSRNDYTFYPTIPHHHENNNDYTPPQKPKNWLKNKRNIQILHAHSEKSCIFAEHSPNSNAGYEKEILITFILL